MNIIMLLTGTSMLLTFSLIVLLAVLLFNGSKAQSRHSPFSSYDILKIKEHLQELRD